jgi:predicted hotdog family 3-hydroxylacyl-ACP dehydratase
MSFPDILELLPHRPPMLWIDEVLAREADEVRCKLTIRDDHLFVDENGTVEPITSIEWIAQAVAALVGVLDRDRLRKPRPGYLIAIPEATFHVAAFAVGDVLEIVARRIWGDDTLASFEGAVHRDGALATHAQLSVFRNPHTAQVTP